MKHSEFDEMYLEAFIRTAVERHRIYVKRMAGAPKPWSDDVIYQDFFFCNLFRQYDKCSAWIIDNILPFERWDLIILYRFISAYHTYEGLQREGVPLDDLDAVHKYLQDHHTAGEVLFSGCFIRNPQLGRGRGPCKTFEVPFVIIDDIKKDGRFKEVFAQNTLESMVKYLRQFPATAGFMAYEYACDFEYTDYFNPTDKFTWANMGPGAQQGLSLVLHRTRYKKFSKSEWLHYIRLLLPLLMKAVRTEFPSELVSMREVEHWLCEFQKYVKYLEMKQIGHKVKHRKYDGGIQ